MTQTKYTKGPWIYDKNPITAHTFLITSNDFPIGEVYSGEAILSNPKYGCPEFLGTNGEANARLIAAAPELLEALEIIRDDLMKKKSKTLNELGWINLANQAIARAKGE